MVSSRGIPVSDFWLAPDVGAPLQVVDGFASENFGC